MLTLMFGSVSTSFKAPGIPAPKVELDSLMSVSTQTEDQIMQDLEGEPVDEGRHVVGLFYDCAEGSSGSAGGPISVSPDWSGYEPNTQLEIEVIESKEVPRWLNDLTEVISRHDELKLVQDQLWKIVELEGLLDDAGLDWLRSFSQIGIGGSAGRDAKGEVEQGISWPPFSVGPRDPMVISPSRCLTSREQGNSPDVRR